MTVANKKWDSSTAPATNLNAVKKSHFPKANNSKFWQLIWETYALDPDEDYPVPMDSIEKIYPTKPSESEINQLRKHAHSLGYRLVALEEKHAYSHEEF